MLITAIIKIVRCNLNRMTMFFCFSAISNGSLHQKK
nr:MAG TPA: hypothetical protein [Caudoviricetes sp.]